MDRRTLEHEFVDLMADGIVSGHSLGGDPLTGVFETTEGSRHELAIVDGQLTVDGILAESVSEALGL